MLGNGSTLRLTGGKKGSLQLGRDEDEEELDITPSSSNTAKMMGTERKREANESDCDTGSEEEQRHSRNNSHSLLRSKANGCFMMTSTID